MNLHELDSTMSKLSPKDALRTLLETHRQLSKLIAKHGKRYENGTHPKHRLTNYHSFFIENITDGNTVLDVGCGDGTVTVDLARKRDVKITGVDINGKSIKKARSVNGHPNITYVAQDITAYSGNRVDVVIMSNVLEHIDNRIALLMKLGKMCDKMLIRVPSFDRDWMVPLRKELKLEWRLDSTHRTEYTYAALTQELSKAGMEIAHSASCWGEIWAVAKAVKR